MKMTEGNQEILWDVIRSFSAGYLSTELWNYVRTWGCYQAGEVDTVLALLDPRDRDNLLHSFGRYLLERKVEFASND